jgi:hypothetical protein
MTVGACGSFKMFKNGEFGIVENDSRYAGGMNDVTAYAAAARSILQLGNGLVTYNGSGSYQNASMPLRGEATNAICSFPKYSYAASYAYAHANLDEAYHRTAFPIAYARRNFFHIKPLAPSTNNYLVIIDGVDPTNSITETQNFFVPKTSPTVADPDVSFTLTNTKTIIRRIYPTGGTIASTNVTDNSADSQCIQCGSGMAKVTNATSASAGAQNLGVVITQQGTSGSMPTTTAISGASSALIGVVIRDDYYHRAVLAPAGNGTVAGVTFTVNWEEVLDIPVQWIIAGLTAGTKYNYAFTGGVTTFTQNAGGTYTVDANGVLVLAP